jgi:methyl-accepting chemotaxis protein
MLETVKKTHYRNLALICILTILLGAILTEVVLYFSLSREPGASYAENYTMMAALRKELFEKSTAIYVATSIFIAVGITVISLLYSFRVAGPVYRLGVFARKIASGNLSETVKLRQHDAIHMLANDLNNLASEYNEVITRMENKMKEFKDLAAVIGESRGDAARNAILELSAKRDEINKVLANIKL